MVRNVLGSLVLVSSSSLMEAGKRPQFSNTSRIAFFFSSVSPTLT